MSLDFFVTIVSLTVKTDNTMHELFVSCWMSSLEKQVTILYFNNDQINAAYIFVVYLAS